MDKVYTRINWEDRPAVSTPLSAENLNKMDKAIDSIDTSVVELDKNKPDKITAFIRYNLNELDSIENVSNQNFTIDIDVNNSQYTDCGLGNGWWQIHQYTSGHFYTQIAVKHNTNAYISVTDMQVLYRRKYTSQQWSKWESLSGSARPNLLINGDFQVWQRGTSFNYTNDTRNIYTADRWRMVQSGAGVVATIYKSNDFLSIGTFTKPSGVAASFYQTLEKPLKSFQMEGNDGCFTVSIRYSSTCKAYLRVVDKTTNVTVVQKEMPVSASANSVSETFHYNQLSGYSNMLEVGIFFDGSYEISNGHMNVIYIKLEQGNTATPNLSRPYAEELAMCQRYFRTIDYSRGHEFDLIEYSGTSYVWSMSYPRMRTNPTITLNVGNGGFYLEDSVSGCPVVSSVSMAWTTSQCAKFTTELNQSYTPNLPRLCCNKANSITIDAEIY